MMLAPLTDYKHGITLIQDSGIQLLDFALTPLLDAEFPGKFVRKTASGPLLRLQWEAESGKYQLPAVGNQAAEVVRPEFSYPYKTYLSALGHLGEAREAAELRERLLAIEPDFTVAKALRRTPVRGAADRQHYAEGLRRAGLR